MAERTHTTVRQLDRTVRKAAREGAPIPKVPPYWRPKTRGDCIDLPRPCPYFGCRYHLGLDVTYAGSVRMPFGGDIEAMTETCALDVADEGDHNLEEMGHILNYNKERVRQVILEAMASLQYNLAAEEDVAKTQRQSLTGFGADDAVLDESK